MSTTYGPDISEDEAFDALCEALGCVRNDCTIVHTWRVSAPDPKDSRKTLTGYAKQLKQAVEQVVGMRKEAGDVA